MELELRVVKSLEGLGFGFEISTGRKEEWNGKGKRNQDRIIGIILLF